MIIAYVFVGPKDLPKVAKWLGHAVKRTRAFIYEIKRESGWEDMMNEANDIKNTVKENKNTVQSVLSNVTEEINNVDSEINETVNEIKQNTFRR